MKKLTLVILIVILIGAGAAYQFFLSNPGEEFTTVKAEKTDITEQVSVTGSLVPLKRIELQPKVKGQVEKVTVEISDEIKKGDTLLKLERDQTQIQVQKNQSNVKSVKQ